MILAANWKAYIEDSARAKQLLDTAKRLARATGVRILLAPSAPFLGQLAAGNTSAVAFAAQDVSATTGGAQTGEVTAQAYAAAGATYAIIGHSERRARGDTNSVVSAKLSHVLAHGLVPILCIGESVRDEEGRYLSYLREEITSAFAGLSVKARSNILIAYEPVWAIGKTAADALRPEELAEMVLYIRKVLTEQLPGKGASRALILYGGSVEPSNARALAGQSGIDGFLVGHASVDPNTFSALVKSLA